MPPSVKAVDELLFAFETDDTERAVAAAWSKDRELLRKAMEERKKDPNGKLALLLPPKPVEHEILEIAKKEEGRQVIIAMVRMKNPLPFASERVGQKLPYVPKTRSEHRRFLAIKEGERWGAKLDLEAIKKRTEFAEQILDLIAKKDLDEAEALLKSAPPPPDEPNAQKKDRLVEQLQADIAKWRKHFHAKTSTVPLEIDTPKPPPEANAVRDALFQVFGGTKTSTKG